MLRRGLLPALSLIASPRGQRLRAGPEACRGPGLTSLPSRPPVALLCPVPCGAGPPQWGQMSSFHSRTLGCRLRGMQTKGDVMLRA